MRARFNCYLTPFLHSSIPPSPHSSSYLGARALLTTLMPKRDNLKVLPVEAVVDEVANAAEVKATNLLLPRVFNFRSNTGLFDQDSQRGLEVLGNSARCRGSVLAPPCSRIVNVPLRERLDPYAQCQDQPYLRSRSNISSAEMPLCLSASSKASSSSASVAGARRTADSDSLAKTVTNVPSGKDRFSRTTLPLTTFPVVTCMAR